MVKNESGENAKQALIMLGALMIKIYKKSIRPAILVFILFMYCKK